ncbi:Tex family protein [Pedobacter montanisoli]|uniref:RNA-binding transcriptional accessory protein n=1 Tax=Pedobacter montanisoli TaxID=2923277 RepID=A0ABS9ZSQ2_9SPHI|nr:Tex family protein [Pedobacter montanisoli]MCJ0741625.1 RNA-binding transcriptional accessory protein [Pedobacter montanisoli]
MNANYPYIATRLALKDKQVKATLDLLEEGATIPFISRYRKEITGSLDEVQIAQIRDLAQQLRELEKRREAILKSLTELDKLNPELEKKIREAETLSLLEDIYLPFKPKRKTRASVAKEKGLEPLALKIFAQHKMDLESEAETFVNEEKGVLHMEDAIVGARDIIAELISEHSDSRERMRSYFEKKATYKSTVVKNKEAEAIKYKDYFDWEETAKTAPSHRVLAMRRGEEEGYLKLDVLPEDEGAITILQQLFIKGNNSASQQVDLALQDGYKRLLKPSMETELRALTKQKADEEAIRVFAENARQLLMAAPLGQKNVMAIDPGFRTGCKVVCLDRQGTLLENTTIYPHTGQGNVKDAGWKINQLCDKHEIEAIAIGNGTAGRETETFIRNLKLANITIVMVNESGASIYSASPLAREEFPDHDVTVRGAVSIGRRLMDPLAELVKIDPKSIGVGQYQHDVDQSKLQQSLDDTVMSCVNAVGVELNTASKQILAYVSGLGESLAQNIITYRTKNGPFKNRESLKKVPRLGDKAFEQAAGFLRIRNAENALDSSGVHPERYNLVKEMAADLGVDVKQLMHDKTLHQKIHLNKYVSAEVGLPTLQDIMKELAKPGRDPREQFEAFSFADGINSIEDLKTGMKLQGIVTNITNFGAFVDIGVHQDGLVHTSQMANRFVANPNEIVKVSQVVSVTVTDVDIARKRISLSMKEEVKEQGTKSREKQFQKKEQKPKHFQQQPKTKKEADGDLQTKLAKLKDMFK